MKRRTLLKRGFFGGALLFLGGGIGLALMPGRLEKKPSGKLRVFDATEFAILAVIAERFLSPLQVESAVLAERVDDTLSYASKEAQADVKKLLRTLESAPVGALLDGRFGPFSAASADAQAMTLRSWRDSRILLRRSGYHALRKLIHAAYYADPKTWPEVAYPGPPVVPA